MYIPFHPTLLYANYFGRALLVCVHRTVISTQQRKAVTRNFFADSFGFFGQKMGRLKQSKLQSGYFPKSV